MTINAMNSGEALRLAALVAEKAGRHQAELGGLWHELQALARLLRAWGGGRYRHIGWRTAAVAGGALVYFLNPFDAVPDFLPGIGFLDDATVVALVFAQLRDEVQGFLAWERQRPDGGATTTSPS